MQLSSDITLKLVKVHSLTSSIWYAAVYMLIPVKEKLDILDGQYVYLQKG